MVGRLRKETGQCGGSMLEMLMFYTKVIKDHD